ncbi:MAG TPA: ABC transporter ATP-binding protein [Pseudonocardiaceae bacterium]|nr:ABC transporter ATP-binding protein [Pseudonocardiaceae bacterium]
MHDGSGRITVQGLTKQFGPVTAVQNLGFTVEPGSVTGFLGPNGAGKTTTLRMILGLVRPTGGVATINGVGFTELGQPARVVGAVLEAQGFHPKRTARDHLRVYAAAIGVPDIRADQVLQLVGLGDAGGRNAGGFSLGMKQRLALATALLGDPQILVLDEPANGLDPEGIAWLRQFLQAFARTGRTVLISSHLLAEVEQTVDHVIIISRGQTMYNGPLDNLRRSQQSRVLVQPSDAAALTKALRDAEIYNVEALQDGRLAVGGVQAKQVADIALQAGVSVYGIEEERVNLEQLYFSLTNGAGTFGSPMAMPQQQFQQAGYPQQHPQQYGQQYQQPYQQPTPPPGPPSQPDPYQQQFSPQYTQPHQQQPQQPDPYQQQYSQPYQQPQGYQPYQPQQYQPPTYQQQYPPQYGQQYQGPPTNPPAPSPYAPPPQDAPPPSVTGLPPAPPPPEASDGQQTGQHDDGQQGGEQ